MPYVAPEDVGTMPRRSLSAHRRLQAWERTGGVCVICEAPIDGVRERWIVEHIRALELGGADDLANMGPAHEACGRTKTRDDHARTAQAKRQKIQHLGAAEPSRPVPGSRGTRFKRKINGRVVMRNGEEPETDSPDAVACRAPISGTRSRVHNKPSDPHPPCTGNNPPGMVNEHRTDQIMPAPHDQPSTPSSQAQASETAPTTDILPAVPHQLGFMFDDRPVLPGESPHQYDALLREIVRKVRPADAIEAIWVKDVVDLIWEAKRLRRMRLEILKQGHFAALTNLLHPTFLGSQYGGTFEIKSAEARARKLALGWLGGEAESRAEVDNRLASRGSTTADVTAAAFHLRLSDMERIDRMAAAADHRRDALLREIERSRTSVGQQLRAASTDVLNVEPVAGEGASLPQG
ncbi:HNH endonuclease [Methylobacterium sp. CB376]|uniref:HNH endonuclease n=1 Tax=unclassified Methylobacterium TaxID=2615210 RepID=UPI000152DCA8|nr:MULTISPECIES: HNH endonuclease [Methylobacterium]WFT83397.1 HNH endonuclease [Methylobacterium nodulans]